MRSYHLLCATGLLLALSAAPVWADPITQIVSFGDSLSDTGNSFAQYGYPASPPYSPGRYSNGPIWLERLATQLKVGAPTPSSAGGLDYAFGGAATDTPAISPQAGFAPLINPALKVIGLAPNVNTQIASYLGSHTANTGTLYTLWAGANDFFDGQTNPAVVADNLKADLENLISKGAKNFLVANLPSLGQTPLGRSQGAAAQAGLNALSQGFNAELNADLNALQTEHPDVTIHRLDAYGLFQQVETNPSAFGLTDATNPAYDFFSPLGANNPNPNADNLLFFDDVHPTAAGSRIIADAAYAAVAPEPSVVTLLTGCAGFLGCVRFLRRKRMN